MYRTDLKINILSQNTTKRMSRTFSLCRQVTIEKTVAKVKFSESHKSAPNPINQPDAFFATVEFASITNLF